MSDPNKPDDRSSQLADADRGVSPRSGQEQAKSEPSSERSKRSKALARKQHEFLKGFKKDGKQSLNDSNLSDSSLQSDRTMLDCNQNVRTDLRPTDQQFKQANKSDRRTDQQKTHSMNSRKLLQSIISRNMLTKINLPNLHLSIEDLSEEGKRMNANYEEMECDARDVGYQDERVGKPKGKFKKDDSLESCKLSSKSSSKSGSRDGSGDSSINSSKDSLNEDYSRSDGKETRSGRKRNGKQRKGNNKRTLSKDELMADEKENQDDLTCSSEPTEVLNEREKRRSVGYPGLAFGFSIFSSNTMMRFRLISNELHNIQNVQLKRVMPNGQSLSLSLSLSLEICRFLWAVTLRSGPPSFLLMTNLINHSCRLNASRPASTC